MPSYSRDEFFSLLRSIERWRTEIVPAWYEVVFQAPESCPDTFTFDFPDLSTLIVDTRRRQAVRLCIENPTPPADPKAPYALVSRYGDIINAIPDASPMSGISVVFSTQPVRSKEQFKVAGASEASFLELRLSVDDRVVEMEMHTPNWREI